MRTRLATAAALIAACAAAAAVPAPAHAIGVGLRHELLPPGTTLQACLARGSAAIQRAGLQGVQTTPNAVWGEGQDGTVYFIYCTPDGRTALIGGAAADSVDDQTVLALHRALRAGTSGSAGGATPIGK